MPLIKPALALKCITTVDKDSSYGPLWTGERSILLVVEIKPSQHHIKWHDAPGMVTALLVTSISNDLEQKRTYDISTHMCSKYPVIESKS
ncbi:hypothetical protein K7432_005408 [Basidiobolus ranarum]|uniref:Uncharacterized protein n=1 Tax=Basidiobolus ranarum TaxID=34480 RepID=A0ABR2W475_9FUNG